MKLLFFFRNLVQITMRIDRQIAHIADHHHLEKNEDVFHQVHHHEVETIKDIKCY